MSFECVFGYWPAYEFTLLQVLAGISNPWRIVLPDVYNLSDKT